MIKLREVLGVSKPGPDYAWFNLIVDGLSSLVVNDSDVLWEIRDNAEKTVADVRRKRYSYKIGENVHKSFQVKSVKIYGPKDQILNLLHNLGMGTPLKEAIPLWQKDKYGDDEDYR